MADHRSDLLFRCFSGFDDMGNPFEKPAAAERPQELEKNSGDEGEDPSKKSEALIGAIPISGAENDDATNHDSTGQKSGDGVGVEERDETGDRGTQMGRLQAGGCILLRYAGRACALIRQRRRQFLDGSKDFAQVGGFVRGDSKRLADLLLH